MKLLKWLSISLIGLCVALVLCLEGYYLSIVSKLDLKQITTESSYPQMVYDALWIESGETGEITLEATSATGVAFSFLKIALADSFYQNHYSEYFGKGFMTASQISQSVLSQRKPHVANWHLSTTATAIWLSKNTEIHPLLAYQAEESYFGENSYGLKSASQFYLNKETAKLNLSEVVSMISLLKAPSTYNPYTNPERFKERAENLFLQLQKNWPEKYGSFVFSLPQIIERDG